MRFRYVFFVVATAVACSLLTWTWATAQATAIVPTPPRVMSGNDIGFRVTGLRGDTPIGQLVVRVNGSWVDAEIAPVYVRPLPVR